MNLERKYSKASLPVFRGLGGTKPIQCESLLVFFHNDDLVYMSVRSKVR